MQAVVIGKTNLRECPKCEGIWADTASLKQICEDREEQAAVLGDATSAAKPVNLEENIHYLRCPICSTFMNRVNFAHCSGVIVDVCRAHGTWFDKDELQRIVEFIRGGGMDRAREEEMAELQRRREALRAAQIGGGAMEPSPLLSRQRNYNDLGSGIASAAAHLFTSFLGMEE
jgi:Zn-finger nucleic acid-binding protein